MEPGFIPKTSILGIYRTSFGIQLGEINNYLCLVIYRGKDVILFKKFEEIKVNSIKDANYIISWILSNFKLFNIDPYQVSRTVRYLLVQLNKMI